MEHCSKCRRPLTGPDESCPRCGRPALDPRVVEDALRIAQRFAHAHARDPWLRSAGLLSYSLRAQRRGFLDDPARPFTRSALRMLYEISQLGAGSGLSPLAETALTSLDKGPLARALAQILERHRPALEDADAPFEEWLSRIRS
ncbi:hypothetical protein DRQ53_03595 [bacterium]|nr:MAG: hypothetical protein DRQ53_03595 [bacterium]